MRTMRSFQTTAASVRALQSQKSVLCCVIDSPTSIVVSQETRDWIGVACQCCAAGAASKGHAVSSNCGT